MGKNLFEPTLTEKIAEFVAKRYAVILVSSSLAVVVSAMAVIAVEKSKEAQLRTWQEIAKEASSKVVVATVDGRVALVEKQPLQPEIAKAVINNFVRNYFLFDIQHLIGGVENLGTRPQTFEEFLKKSPLVQSWLKGKFLTPEAAPQMRALLQYYWGLLSSEKIVKIPYTLYYKKVKNEEFKEFEDGKWVYKSKWEVEYTYLKPDRGLGVGTAEAKVELMGKFVMFKGNYQNPLGIKIISIKFTPILAGLK